ncbi:hypothetical protein N7476_001831 [Penicillium atrosanguineum]|uniref:Zn(2)-C6 fungal-type domain-containing protein n=1 Tax=Penicillium atrosanguineum TaxID=1132637 RepID=A0A9W9Q2A6_9EURO|nr:hypothetical protein N7476_001831 [Penicillium atrosanguineum]
MVVGWEWVGWEWVGWEWAGWEWAGWEWAVDMDMAEGWVVLLVVGMDDMEGDMEEATVEALAEDSVVDLASVPVVDVAPEVAAVVGVGEIYGTGDVTPIRNLIPPRPDYRRPRRRPAHLRTTTGCLTCRKRKKKCDETRLQCLNCAKRDLDCVWQSDIQHESSSLQQCSFSETSPATVSTVAQVLSHCPSSRLDRAWKHSVQLPVAVSASGKPAQPAASISDNMHPELSVFSHVNLHRILQLPPPSLFSYSPAITTKSGPLFDFLKTTFLPQLIHPGTSIHVSDALSKQTFALALNKAFCMHALLACCGVEIPSNQASFRQLGRYHYTHAVAGLRKNLNDGCLQGQWVVAMFTVMMLCIYERSKPGESSGVEIHLAGAAQLIQLASRGQELDFQEPGIEQAMQRLVRESFIFHVTTSLPFQEKDRDHRDIEGALALAEEAVSQHCGPQCVTHLESPVLGFQPRLFRSVYIIYRLYRMSDRDRVSLETCQRLDDDLYQWEDYTKPAMASPANIACVGPKLYILGCRILLRRMSPSILMPALSIPQLAQEGMEIIHRLKPAQDYYADYYCWPFLVIGMNVGDPRDQDSLMRQVRSFETATNNGTMRRLVEILKRCWNTD